MADAAAARRSSLLVAGDDQRHVEEAARHDADQLVFDLAGVPPPRKDVARDQVAAALERSDHGDALVAVRVNAIGTMWAYRDIVDVVERAGEGIDGIVIPDVDAPADVSFVDALLGMISARLDLDHLIDIDVEVASPQALELLDEIALASERIDALVVDEAAMLVRLGTAAAAADLVVADVRMRLLTAARAIGAPAIAGPAPTGDQRAYEATIAAARDIGFDGARAQHPREVAIANDVFAADAGAR